MNIQGSPILIISPLVIEIQMSAHQRGKQREIILLSIDSAFAEQIYDREKTYEFRKTPLPTDIEYVILLENGSREITGGFVVEEIHEEEIDDLWENYGKPISKRNRFFDYYSGWDKGLAIEISEAERFDLPVDVDELVAQDPSLEVPNQFHFIYMPNRSLRQISPQSRYLDDFLPESRETTLDQYNHKLPENQDLNFRPMKPSEEHLFRDLFSESPVPTDYADITPEFINHIIESHNLGKDPYGYFTIKKKVYSLISRDELIGFTATTWKRGGSVKYGPTVIKKNERGKGYGPKLRKLIDSRLKHDGIRKTYSTIPESATNAYKYLIKSGYKVEAHLHRQYTKNHSELVFGKVLRSSTPPESLSVERNPVDDLRFEVGSQKFDGFAIFVKECAEPWYDEINDEFVKAVEEAEERGLQSEFSKKGKKVFIGHESGEIGCIGIASKKRGKAVKISPIFTRISGKELSMFIDFIESNLREDEKIRKLYTHVPILDDQLCYILSTNNYQSEGVIRQPYKDGVDMLVLAKMVE
jgi:predicted transcriptional regulator